MIMHGGEKQSVSPRWLYLALERRVTGATNHILEAHHALANGHCNHRSPTCVPGVVFREREQSWAAIDVALQAGLERVVAHKSALWLSCPPP